MNKIGNINIMLVIVRLSVKWWRVELRDSINLLSVCSLSTGGVSYISLQSLD